MTLEEELIEKFKNERDLVLVPKEIARYARVSEKTVREWLKKGIIKGFKLGTLWRISVAELRQDIPNLPDRFWLDAAIDHYGKF